MKTLPLKYRPPVGVFVIAILSAGLLLALSRSTLR